MTRVDEIGPELQINHGVIDTQDYTNPELPLYFLKADPVFLLHNAIFDEDKVHAMIVTGVDNNFLVYNAHSNDRNHEPFKNINLIGGWFLRHFLMPNAPIIKYVKLTQVQSGKTIYDYLYDEDYDPTKIGEYYDHTYNGLSPKRGNPNPAVSGELYLKIIFDTTMRPNVSISCGLNQPYEDYAFSTVQWTDTHQASDTWEGKTTIPAIGTGGSYTIKVNGYALDGSQIDSNGNLTTYNPGPDLVHKFNTDSVAYLRKLSVYQYGECRYEAEWSTPTVAAPLTRDLLVNKDNVVDYGNIEVRLEFNREVDTASMEPKITLVSGSGATIERRFDYWLDSKTCVFNSSVGLPSNWSGKVGVTFYYGSQTKDKVDGNPGTVAYLDAASQQWQNLEGSWSPGYQVVLNPIRIYLDTWPMGKGSVASFETGRQAVLTYSVEPGWSVWGNYPSGFIFPANNPQQYAVVVTASGGQGYQAVSKNFKKFQ